MEAVLLSASASISVPSCGCYVAAFATKSLDASPSQCRPSIARVSQSILAARVAGQGSRRQSPRAVVCMSTSLAARGYAAALVELGKGSGNLEAIHNDMDALASVLQSKDLSGYLASPVVDDARKKEILKTLADQTPFNPSTLNFLNLLVDKRRINVVADIVDAFDALYCEVTNTQIVVITSAVKLENPQKEVVEQKLQSVTGAKNIKLKNITDPSLIAGFIVKYGKDGSSEIDMSVKGQLDRLMATIDKLENAASPA